MKDELKKNHYLPKKIFFPIGSVFIIIGIALIILSFNHEILDDKYIVKDVTEYTSDINKSLKKGEMVAFKNTKYMGKGIYEITYLNHARAFGKKKLVDQGTYFNITDMFGNGYELDKSNIVINDNSYKLGNDEFESKEGINVSYQNNVLDIGIPSDRILKDNVIIISLKLVGRDSGVKYITSQDAYYSFVPSVENDFYGKKNSQAYVIDGFGYIKLEDK